MRKTNFEQTNKKIMVDFPTLQNMLCLGRQTAEEIAEKSGAIRKFGRRRMVVVSLVEKYLSEKPE